MAAAVAPVLRARRWTIENSHTPCIGASAARSTCRAPIDFNKPPAIARTYPARPEFLHALKELRPCARPGMRAWRVRAREGGGWKVGRLPDQDRLLPTACTPAKWESFFWSAGKPLPVLTRCRPGGPSKSGGRVKRKPTAIPCGQKIPFSKWNSNGRQDRPASPMAWGRVKSLGACRLKTDCFPLR